MQRQPVTSSAQTAIYSHDMTLTAAITFLKCLGIYAHSAAGNQITHREAITAGVVDAELR